MIMIDVLVISTPFFVLLRLVQKVRPELIKRIKRVKSPFAWRVSFVLLFLKMRAPHDEPDAQCVRV